MANVTIKAEIANVLDRHEVALPKRYDIFADGLPVGMATREKFPDAGERYVLRDWKGGPLLLTSHEIEALTGGASVDLPGRAPTNPTIKKPMSVDHRNLQTMAEALVAQRHLDPEKAATGHKEMMLYASSQMLNDVFLGHLKRDNRALRAMLSIAQDDEAELQVVISEVIADMSAEDKKMLRQFQAFAASLGHLGFGAAQP
ncbi:hypothetical protein [Methylorubrum populi]